MKLKTYMCFKDHFTSNKGQRESGKWQCKINVYVINYVYATTTKHDKKTSWK